MKLNNENELPRSRCEILKWARIYFNLEPAINDIITEAVDKLGEVEIKCSDKKLNTFYQSLAYNDKFNLDTFINSMALSYFKFGEAIPYGKMVENRDGKSVWEQFILLEPELVEVDTDIMSHDSKFSLIMTEEIKQQVKEGAVTQPNIVEAVKNGTNLELPERDISLLARFTDPSATRGTSPAQGSFRDLMYLEKLRDKASKWYSRNQREDIKIVSNRIKTSLSFKTLGNLPNVRRVIRNWIEHKFFKPVMKLNNIKTPPVITWNIKENK